MHQNVIVHPNQYQDSAFLMRLSRQLQDIPGVTAAVVLMGTQLNRDLLLAAGYTSPALDKATPMDMVVAIRSDSLEAEQTALDQLDELMRSPQSGSRPQRSSRRYVSLEEALEHHPNSNLVSIAVPGQYAAFVADRALDNGRHVFLFSNNVSLNDEIRLKQRARKLGLLLMGPDCGTAVLGGVGLGFANRVRRGKIGLVGASGTGMQELMCQIHQKGQGISQAIGVGSQDLSLESSACMAEFALQLLGRDDETQVIVLVAKHPARAVATRLEAIMLACQKPVVVRYLGQPSRPSFGNVAYTDSLDQAALQALRHGQSTSALEKQTGSASAIACSILGDRSTIDGRLVGLFGGGSLASEAFFILQQRRLNVAYPNHAISLSLPLEGTAHLIVDTGAEWYTQGRPHPMIDQNVRCQMLQEIARDTQVTMILLDVVLGDGAHLNPAPELVEAVEQARLHTEKPAVGRPGFGHGHRSGSTKHRGAKAPFDFGWHHRSAFGRPGCSTGVFVASRRGQGGNPMKLHSTEQLFAEPRVLHLGVDDVVAGVKAAGKEFSSVAFSPPAGGNPKVIDMLTQLYQPEQQTAMRRANQLALDKMLACQPQLIGVGIAREVIPDMTRDLFLHAGPPIEWERMSGPLRGAVIGGILLEGQASDVQTAQELAASGRIGFSPCHHHNTVGPMAGLVTASMPVWIIQNKNSSLRTFCTLNEGLGKVLRYGAYSQEVLDRLHFMAQILGPILNETICNHGPLDLKTLMAQALQMGDEGHNRNRAGTSLLIRALAPNMVRLPRAQAEIAQALSFIDANDHFFLNLSMPMAKCITLCACDVPGSSLVSTMARNGTDFGIQLSALPGQWFIGPAQPIAGLYFPGFTAQDANPDIGDSTIMETVGLGAFAMAAAPAIVQFVGGSAVDAIETTTENGPDHHRT